MDTIIEIFDNLPIFNVYAASVLKPKRVVFIGGRRMTHETVKSRLSGFFTSIGLDIDIEYCCVNLSDFDAIVRRHRKILLKYPDCAIDLTGGMETVIAAAGLLSCELGAKLFCENPRCISATEQELHHAFKLVNREMGICRCIYCESKKVLNR